MKYVMVGSGAVGGYFGGLLQQAGHEVVFVARGSQLNALREGGLTICDGDQEIHLPSVTVTDDLTTIGAVDHVLISVKTWQVAEIALKLPLLKKESTRFLTLQNGVEAPEIVAAQVERGQTLGGVVRGFFRIKAPGTVRHNGVQPAIVFGQIDGQRTPPTEQLLRDLSALPIYAELSNDIEAALWEKFAMVTALGGVGAVTRSTIGEIRDYPPTWQMFQKVMIEIVRLAQTRGIHLQDEMIDRVLKFVSSFPPELTTSMQRDIMAGLPSELDAQTGAVVRLGREVSAATPINQLIYDSLILQENRARAAHS